MLFHRVVLEGLLASATIGQACGLLDIDCDAAQAFMGRAVARGLARRQLQGLKHLGMDEKRVKHGQFYVSWLTKLDQARVLDVAEQRTTAAVGRLWQPFKGARQLWL